jgi:hypothetical protein
MEEIKVVLAPEEANVIEELQARREELTQKVNAIMAKHQVAEDSLVFYDRQNKILRTVNEALDKTNTSIVGKKNVPLLGMLVIFLVTVAQGLGLVQIGEYDTEAVLTIDWSMLPLALMELVFILFLSKEKGLWGAVKKMVFNIIKKRVKKNVSTKE